MKRLLGIGLVAAMVGANAAQALTYIDAMNINIYGGSYGGPYPSTGTPTPSQNPSIYGASYWNQVTFGGGGGATASSLSSSGGEWKGSVMTANGIAVSVLASGFYIGNAATKPSADSSNPAWNDQSWGDGYQNTTWGLVNAANHGADSIEFQLTLNNLPFESYEAWGYISRAENYKDLSTYSWVKLSGAVPETTVNFTTTWSSGRYNSLAALQILQVESVPEPGTVVLLGSLLGLAGLGGLRKRFFGAKKSVVA